MPVLDATLLDTDSEGCELVVLGAKAGWGKRDHTGLQRQFRLSSTFSRLGHPPARSSERELRIAASPQEALEVRIMKGRISVH